MLNKGHIFDWLIYHYFLQLIFRLTPLTSDAKCNEKWVNQKLRNTVLKVRQNKLFLCTTFSTSTSQSDYFKRFSPSCISVYQSPSLAPYCACQIIKLCELAITTTTGVNTFKSFKWRITIILLFKHFSRIVNSLRLFVSRNLKFPPQNKQLFFKTPQAKCSMHKNLVLIIYLASKYGVTRVLYQFLSINSMQQYWLKVRLSRNEFMKSSINPK